MKFAAKMFFELRVPERKTFTVHTSRVAALTAFRSMRKRLSPICDIGHIATSQRIWVTHNTLSQLVIGPEMHTLLSKSSGVPRDFDVLCKIQKMTALDDIYVELRLIDKGGV